MIIELVRIEPEGGRNYYSARVGDILALECLRLEVQSAWYTKFKVESQEELQQIITKTFRGKVDTTAEAVYLCHGGVTGLRWFEAVCVLYRRAGEAHDELAVGIGYTLTLYGAEARPTRLYAELGPVKAEKTDVA